ncbi:MAG: adenylate/guanylate cyclase domain-containing protein [Chloroflexota bacterium]|nr:adenylate/guanylate cyclase domain-containing protein [Chloroflexota bacterium]
MPSLDNRTRATLKDSAFAYVDSQGRRRLPINDAAHVRNALARFEQVAFEDDAARERAREKLLRAAKKHGIVPLGFFNGQIRKERAAVQTQARTAEMARWPRGAVTFLFTDIEGSTAHLRRLGDSYAAVLRNVRSIIRRSVKAAGGHEVDARADEFFAAFGRPAKALDAAIAMQGVLAGRSWPGGDPVRIRIGLHSGHPTLSEGGYVGIAVHTAARICDAGHGGQILVSAATVVALGALRDAVEIRTLGRYRLEGLADPEDLSQVIAAGLGQKFPRLRARAARAPRA